MMKVSYYYTTLITLLIASFAVAQISIRGRVMDKNNNPLHNAKVQVIDLPIKTYTDSDGVFILNIGSVKNILEISSGEYKIQYIDLYKVNNLSDIEVRLNKDILEIEGVVVTAKKKYSKEGSSSYTINSQSIKQIQAMDLGDVLSLLPGKKMQAPELTQAKVASLRATDYSDVNSFGTSIILDGAVLSNDANLQSLNPASSLYGGKATVGSGFDLRQISVANIKSVEIITGVPSPKYGNISSGTIIVESKVGSSPWITNANISSTNYQASIAKGFELKKYGLVNTDFSYAYSLGSPTEKKVFYQNFNWGARWKLPKINGWNWNHFTSFRVVYSNDGTRHEPDEYYKVKRDVKNSSFQFGLSGDITSSVLGKVNYQLNSSITNQYSFFDTYQINGPFPIIEALESGTYKTTFTPTFFPQLTEIKGKPVHYSANFEAAQHINYRNFDMSFDTGFQFSFDDNFGKGRVVSGTFAHPNVSVGNRSASFNKIPASKIYALYHQTGIKHQVKNFLTQLNLGLRYDYMLDRYHLWSPRISGSSKYKRFTIRGAWGLSYKAPALIQLYPGKTYIDFTNLTYYADNPKERLAVVTTHVHQPINTHLKPNYQDLTEVGLDWDGKFVDFQITLFDKKLERGIQYTDELLFLPLQKYRVVETPKDNFPVVEPIPGDITKIAREINVLKNNFHSVTKGVEIIANTDKIKATNTSFNFRYSYLKSLLTDTGYRIKPSTYTIGNQPARFGVYRYPDVESIKSFGTLTLIQHIPALRFILTLSAEFNFKNYQKRLSEDVYPYAYYNMDGQLFNVNVNPQNEVEFKDLILSKREFLPVEEPFYTNFNLQIRKETKQGHSFSFFANNAPWKTVEYEVEGNRRRLKPQLTVGLSLSLIIN